ncbi:MAG: alpha/beta fold hydrolase [Granulosicoccus sp.]
MKKLFIRVLFGALAFNLALILLTQLLSMQAVNDHPMQGTLIEAGGHRLHVIDSMTDAGDANLSEDFTIILIHGASTSALDFDTNLHPLLARQWRVVSIDRPGHGYSDRGPAHLASNPAQQAQMILDTLQTMDIDNPVFVGHSWAGSVVMAALLAEHDQVQAKAGVLIAGATHPWEGGSDWHVELSARPVIGNVFVWQYIAPLGRLSLESAIEGVFAPESVPPDYIENTGLTLSLRPRTFRYNSIDRIQLRDHLVSQASRYPTISLPLLSIAASEDHVVPAWNHHDRLIEQISHLNTLKIEGAGHAPHHTRPDVVADAIAAFLHSLQ